MFKLLNIPTHRGAGMENKIIAYKAFDEDWKCRGFQYVVGESYTHDGGVRVCGSGFHACLNPLDVLSYYDLTTSKFAAVELSGEISEGDEGCTKVASAEIHIKAELKLPDFIKAGINWVFEQCKQDAASGNCSQLAASGDGSKLAASGNYSQLAASGNYSKLAASGDDSQLAASGDDSKLAASGNYSKLAASGKYSQLAASGDDCIVVSSGLGAKAKAGPGGVIALPYRDKNNKPRISVGYVGEDLKPDVFYGLDGDGNFMEVAG